MAEGRTAGWYISDQVTVYDNTGAGAPAQFKFQVPNNLLGQARLGWAVAPTTVPSGLRDMKGWRPRRMNGIGSNGLRYATIVADVASDLWTLVVNTWTIIDNNGATITVTATGKSPERYTF
jgi:hypothetical protein